MTNALNQQTVTVWDVCKAPTSVTDANQQVTTTSRSFANGVTTSYQYSPTRGWIDNIHTTKGTTTHQNLTYQHYADGMIQSITSAKSMESWTYVYDDLNRLLTATNVDTSDAEFLV